ASGRKRAPSLPRLPSVADVTDTVRVVLCGAGMGKSQYLAGLDAEQRARLEQKLLARQSGRCFICDQPIDLVLHKGQLDVDHIDPLIEDGLDAENNFAITHASCNRTKGASNLQIARRLAEFERLQEQAQEGGRG